MPQLFTVLTPQQAWSKIEPHLSPLVRIDAVATNEALGRVLAEDINSPVDVPHFPRSAMDGYAVRAEDTHGSSESLPSYLKLAGEIAMGRPAGVVLLPGEAALIHTGGMLPADADAVVMLENTRDTEGSGIEVVRPVARGENVIQVGEDMVKGEPLLSRGSVLRPQDIGGLLSVGLAKVRVFGRVKVALIPTGDELVPPEEEPGMGQIRNTNAYALAAMALQAGAVPIRMGIVRDDYEALEQAAQAAMDMADMVVISAGSSVSARDMTADVINALGAPGVLVHGVALRPGKPMIIASVGGKPIFGLPGNPASAMITFQLFVVPAIHRLSGARKDLWRLELKAKVTRNIPSAAGREDFIPVRLEERDGELYAEPVFGKSNMMFAMMRGDGVATVPLQKAGIAAGETVTVRLF